MVWGAIIAGGATLLSGAMQSSGASDASQAQVDASRLAVNEQRDARESFEQRTDPFRLAGLSVLPALSELLGIQMPDPRELELQRSIEALDAAIEAGPEVIEEQGGLGGFFEAGLGQQGGEKFKEFALSPFDILGGGQVGVAANFEGRTFEGEFDEEGLTARRAELQSELDSLQADRSTPSQVSSTTGQSLLEQANPLVSFVRDQGFEDIQESAAAQGRLRSGGTLQDLTEFNTNVAATVVPQLQQQRFNQLFNLLGLGQNAAAGQGSAALSTSTNISNLLQGQGQAQAQAALQQGQIAANTTADLAGIFGRFSGNQSTQQATPMATGVVGSVNPGVTTSSTGGF